MEIVARTTPQLGAALRRVRRRKDLSQRDLGERMHARQATVSRLENGEPGTRLGVLIDALAALDLELVVRPRGKVSKEQIEELF